MVHRNDQGAAGVFQRHPLAMRGPRRPARRLNPRTGKAGGTGMSMSSRMSFALLHPLAGVPLGAILRTFGPVTCSGQFRPIWFPNDDAHGQFLYLD